MNLRAHTLITIGITAIGLMFMAMVPSACTHSVEKNAETQEAAEEAIDQVDCAEYIEPSADIEWTNPEQYKTSDNTWTEAIQLALNQSENVLLSPNKVYEVVKTGTKNYNSGFYHYCLTIPGNKRLNLNGSTIKLADAQNAIILLNENFGNDQGDSNIEISNGTFDGNDNGQTIETTTQGEVSTIAMNNVTGLSIHDITVEDALQWPGRFLKIKNSNFNCLKSINSRGDGWSFGLANGMEVSNSRFDNILSERSRGQFDLVKGDTPGAHQRFGQTIITAIDSNIGKLVSVEEQTGIKIENTSHDLTIDSVFFKGAENPEANCGLKIQGWKEGGMIPTRIIVNEVITQNCAPEGPGLYLQDIGDVTINKYSGYDNGGNYPDVWIGQSDSGQLKINSIRSESCGALCVYIREDAGNYWIGKIEIIDPVDDAQGVQIAGGIGRIEQIVGVDNRESADERRLLNVVLPDVDGSVGDITTNFATSVNGTTLFINGDNKEFSIDSYQEGDSKTEGIVKLNQGATSTFVATDSVYSQYVGGTQPSYLQPTIEIALAQGASINLSLLQVEIKDLSVGKGFTINHPSISEDVNVQWKAKGWKVH